MSLQRKLAETKHVNQSSSNQTPDLTDFMNDVFFGTTKGCDCKKAYTLTGGESVGGHVVGNHDEDDFDSSTRSVSSQPIQEWLDEAKKMGGSISFEDMLLKLLPELD
ncbi:hypothetical protein PHJA_002893600 [Phtheirospermum japonicum]|uniref:Uncharacterized protein n=1 Tax=Phtheirospermum japonicum TaxID=374723 RepID=A0A830DGS3_9LAMI|nr:hypothetical protein PHJA_002893600 [Phtheirospermum japonicum]